ncbi:MAG: sulfite exporter TauE/SafE family protein, partial [Betaproteobacteria bacterium]
MLFTLPPDFSLPLVAFIVLTVATGYTMFGAIGFGSSIVSVPLLAHVLPLPFLIPMITAVDLVAGTTAVTRQWRSVRWHEVRLLLLPILIGIGLGLTLLIQLPRNVALGALGLAVGAWSMYALFGMREWRSIKTVWAFPLGLAGGVFSALFGTGGPLYMVFLSSRIDDKTALRAT